MTGPGPIGLPRAGRCGDTERKATDMIDRLRTIPGRRPRWGRILVPGVGAALTLVLALAGPASAAALPYDNTNPATTGCSGSGYTVGTRNIVSVSGQVIGRVELRYSSVCGTNWGRTTSTIGTRPLLTWVVRQADGVTTYGGPGGDPGPYTATSAFSDQVYGNGYVVCAWGALPDPWNGGNYTGTNYCA